MSDRAKLLAIHPVLPCIDVRRSLAFYVDELGFKILILDNPQQPTYAGVRRGKIEIHLKKEGPKAFSGESAPVLRIFVLEVNRLYEEYEDMDIFDEETTLENTKIGTREFKVRDPDGNILIFYKDKE